MRKDVENGNKKISNLESLIRSKDSNLASLEQNEEKYQDNIVTLKSEIARLGGVEELLNDRISYLEKENGNLITGIRDSESETDSLRSKLEDSNTFNNELKISVARLTENKNSVQSINESLGNEVDRLSNENGILKENSSLMKEELSMLRAEVNSLGLEESRISEQLIGLRDANELLLAKANDLEAENLSLKEAIDADWPSNNEHKRTVIIAKVRQIDDENLRLVEESQSQAGGWFSYGNQDSLNTA